MNCFGINVSAERIILASPCAGRSIIPFFVDLAPQFWYQALVNYGFGTPDPQISRPETAIKQVKDNEHQDSRRVAYAFDESALFVIRRLNRFGPAAKTDFPPRHVDIETALI